MATVYAPSHTNIRRNVRNNSKSKTTDSFAAYLTLQIINRNTYYWTTMKLNSIMKKECKILTIYCITKLHLQYMKEMQALYDVSM